MTDTATATAPSSDPYAAYGGQVAPTTAPTTATSQSDPYAVYGGKIADTTPPPDQPGVVSRAVSGAIQGAKDIAAPAVSLIKPPETPMEQVLHSTGGDPALVAYRAARTVVGTAQNLVKAGVDEYPQAISDWKNAVSEFHKGNYRNAATSAAEAGTDAFGIVTPTAAPLAQDTRRLVESTRPGGNFAGEAARQAVQAAPALLIENPFRAKIAAAASTASDAASAAKQAVAPTAEVAGEEFSTRPIVRTAPNVAAGTQAVKNIAQQTTEAAGGVPTTGEPVSLREVWQEPIAAREAVAKGYYKQLDAASNNEWTANENALNNVRKEIRMKGGLSEDMDDALNARKTRLEWQQEQILDKVPAGTTEAAKANWIQKSRLEDLQDIFNKKSNVTGVHPDMVTPELKGKLPPEKYNFKGIAKDLNAMDPDDLTTALGSKKAAQDLVSTANLAAKQGWATGKATAAVRLALQATGLGTVGHFIP